MATSQTTPEIHNALVVERAFIGKLFEAARNGDSSKVKELVSIYSQHNSIDPGDVLLQCKNAEKRTALHLACESTKNDGDDDVVELILLSKWLPPATVESLCRLKDKDGMTPLILAARYPVAAASESRVDMILKAGSPKLALTRSHVGATPLHYAAGSGSSECTVRRLFECGKVALNATSHKIGTPLHWAAAVEPISDFTETMKVLLDLGADLNADNEQGFPPVVMAMIASNDKHATFLVQKGADRSKILPGDVTLFHLAAEMNLVRTLEALLDESSPAQGPVYVARKNVEGNTPLDLAAIQGHLECVILLLPEGEKNTDAAKALIEQHKATRTAQLSDNMTTISPGNEPTDDDGELTARMRALEVSKLSVSGDDQRRAQEHKAAGNLFFGKNEWKKAIELYSAAIDADPTDASFYSNRSASYMMLNQPKEALPDAVLARHLRPRWSKGCYRLAVARLALERYEDAAVAAWEGVQLDPENGELKTLLQKIVKKGKQAHKESLKLRAEAGESR